MTTVVVISWMSEDLGYRVDAKNMQNYLSVVNKAHVHIGVDRPAISERIVGAKSSLLLRDQKLLKAAPKRIRFPADVVVDALVMGVNEQVLPDYFIQLPVVEYSCRDP